MNSSKNALPVVSECGHNAHNYRKENLEVILEKEVWSNPWSHIPPVIFCTSQKKVDLSYAKLLNVPFFSFGFSSR